MIYNFRYNVAELASNAYNKGVTADNLISSFRKTGIAPLNREEINAQKTAPALIYNGGDNLGGTDSVSFLDSKKITAVPKQMPKRKTPPTITGDIISPSKKLLLKPAPAQKVSLKSETKKKNGKVSLQQPLSPVPGTSGVYNNLLSDSESEASDETIIDELNAKELCCVCHKYKPDAFTLEYTLEIVLWAQCDLCSHWTHLKFCTKVRCVRRGDTFLCPHCEK